MNPISILVIVVFSILGFFALVFGITDAMIVDRDQVNAHPTPLAPIDRLRRTFYGLALANFGIWGFFPDVWMLGVISFVLVAVGYNLRNTAPADA